MLRSELVVDKTEAVSGDGMVVAMQPLAAEVGAKILRQGGNAIDAAVATAFAVGVVEPFMSGLGGVAWMTYREASSGRTVCLDAGSTLPAKIDAASFEVLGVGSRSGMYGWRATREDSANTGWLTPVTPGVPALLGTAHERFGRIPWDHVVAPAIGLAGGGFEVSHYVATMLSAQHARLSRFPESRRTFCRRDGSPLAPCLGAGPGDQLIQADLAATLGTMAKSGWQSFYRGVIAERIAGDMAANGGLVDEAELARYQIRVVEPTSASYRGYELLGLLHNTGYATVVESLNILEGFDLAGLGRGSLDVVHLTTEAIRRAFRDRLMFLGDPELVPVPYRGVVAREFAATRRATIDPGGATPDAGPGDPWQFEPSSDSGWRPVRAGVPGEGHTTHITVVDRDRNMVALTATLGAAFGSGVVIKDTGIVMNNGTMWFDPEPGSVTSIGPGKRLMTAASPMIALRDGEPFAALGSPGGRQVMSALVQCLSNVIDFGCTMQEAIALPRVHAEDPDTAVSCRFPAVIIDGLRDRGHRLLVRDEVIGTSWFARPNGILIDSASGLLRGGAYPYTPATAVGI